MNIFSAYPRALYAALALLLALALFSLLRSCGTPAFIKHDLETIHRDLVWQAEQLAGTLDSGSRVVVLEVDYAIRAHGDRVYEQVLAAITAKGLDIQRLEALSVDSEMGWDSSQPGFPYAEFVRVAESFPDADAVIALCGPPYGIEPFPSSSDSSLPRLLVAGGIGGGTAQLLCEDGWLFAATVPRTTMENGKPVLKFELLTCRQP